MGHWEQTSHDLGGLESGIFGGEGYVSAIGERRLRSRLNCPGDEKGCPFEGHYCRFRAIVLSRRHRRGPNVRRGVSEMPGDAASYGNPLPVDSFLSWRDFRTSALR